MEAAEFAVHERRLGESFEAYKARRARGHELTASLLYVESGGSKSARETLRDSQRANGTLRGIYGIGLLQPQRRRNQQARAARRKKLGLPGDEHGAYTFAGNAWWIEGVKPEEVFGPRAKFQVFSGGVDHDGTRWCHGRRVWLAGISAQRGY